jgi:gamma-glutamyltranspeptidase/glutathione hydrolase
VTGASAVRVAVAAPNQAAADAGARAAALGGNAVDAAVAAVLVALSSEPGVASLGGGAFLTIAPAGSGDMVTVDGAVTMPGLGLAADAFGGGLRDVLFSYGGGTAMSVGHGSVGTPGGLAAIEQAHRSFGRIPWREVVLPARDVAAAGFPLGKAAADYLEHAREPVFGWNPEARSTLHHPDGRPLGPAEIVRIHGLAEFLDAVADQGPDVLYRGEVARAIAADMAAYGGLVTAADLDRYRPEVRRALSVPIGRWQLGTNPAPSIGGPVLAAMLLLMDGRPARWRRSRQSAAASRRSGRVAAPRVPGEWSLADVRHLIAVQVAVLRHRAVTLDLTHERDEAVSDLLDGVLESGTGWMPGSPSTLHVSAVDVEGAACSVTASSGYGSGVVAPGTGVWLNNCLGEHELNRTGVHGLPPGARLASNMAPTVARRADGAVLAAGGPGADRITTSLLQALSPLMAGGDLDSARLQRVVDRPRLHVRLDPDPDALVVDHERDLPPGWRVPLDGLAAHARWVEHPAASMYFGGVTLAARASSGALAAAADPRRAGRVAIG